MPPDAGHRAGKIGHPLVLGLVADFAPARVIEVLLATAFIPPGRLQMPMVQRTNPDIAPRRRDGEGPDTVESVPVAQEAAFYGAIAEALTAAFTAEARSLVRDVAQADDLGGLRRGRRGDGVRIDVMTGNPKGGRSPMKGIYDLRSAIYDFWRRRRIKIKIRSEIRIEEGRKCAGQTREVFQISRLIIYAARFGAAHCSRADDRR